MPEQLRRVVIPRLWALAQRVPGGVAAWERGLRLVGRFCDRVLVMYKGRVVEELEARHLTEARHPYTRGLLNCLPRIGGPREPLPGLDRSGDWAKEGAA